MGQKSGCGCQGGQDCEESGLKKMVMVGNPNVGKSALFNRLTGSYVVVSNYPGTTVEVSRGKCRIGQEEFAVEDIPGMYSLLPITEEERVSRDILMAGGADVVLHVVDAKNLKRMLSLTLQLIEADLPVVLVLNMIDEAERLDIRIDTALLEKKLGIPVAAISALSGKGVDFLKERIEEKICRLLGHPETCPHGKPIPPGDCCRKVRVTKERYVAPLTSLKPGETGTIAYIKAGDSKKLQKLMAIGVLPGNAIVLDGNFPSFVFSVGYSQYAVDADMAAAIIVKRG